MAFDVICKNCGAPSGHSVGFCPFCKCPMSDAESEQSASYAALLQSYTSGDLDLSVVQVNKVFEKKDELLEDTELLLLTVKILIETEAPRTRVATLLAEAMMKHPNNEQIKLYYKIHQAKSSLKAKAFDDAEMVLRNVLKADPKNVHANFILGVHLFWDEGKTQEAIKHLETCTRENPKFKRAWGCLSAAYEKIGNIHLSRKAIEKFKELETSSVVKDMVGKVA
jgi:lipopolysaccharide biosynthesis regulator YciM